MVQIPLSATPFFQEYTFDKLDPVTNRELIIERLLAYGNREEIRWLYQSYGREQLRVWISENGARLLPRLRYNLWCVLFKLQPDSQALTKGIWPH
jgi:hypothetical protein